MSVSTGDPGVPVQPAIAEPEARPAYRLSREQILASLATNAERGLAEAEVQARRQQYGRNELAAEKPVPGWKKFLAQFRDPLVVLLLVATLISATLWYIEREADLPYEAIAIFAVVLLNAIMGYVQQARAEQAVAALRRMSAANAKVIRGGVPTTTPATDLVPGDLILLEEGDTVPADARVITSVALQTAEAALTGESLPIPKDCAAIAEQVPLGDRHNMVFSGTAVSYGRGRALVTATGMNTEMGHIAGMLKQAPDEVTPLQKELARVGRLLGVIVIVIAVAMIGTILLVDKVRTLSDLFEVLILGVALAVAAVPEGLPAVVTAVLALGVQRMARRKAIVRHLAAVETLGSANVIASDKTGTLTRNEMTVRAVVTASGQVRFSGTGYSPTGEAEYKEASSAASASMLHAEIERALAVGDRANNAILQEQDGFWTVQGDPTEGALLVAARKAKLQSAALAERFRRVGEVPFSSDRKLMSTLHSDSDRKDRLFVFTKGAPDVLLERCTRELVGKESRELDGARRAAVRRANEEMARQGLRTLGVAFRILPYDTQVSAAADERVEQDLTFAGLVGMIDPPRAEAQEAVGRAKSAGIRPMMITGDHPITARVIAEELGVTQGGRAVTGEDIENTPEEALPGLVQEVSVYARVNPGHKLRIVKALRRTGAVVAMTGDGVNDAPALKTADIGVAMGITGTDVSKQAADIVLADDNFSTIVAAVEEGRAIFANIRKFLRYLLTSNVGEVMTMFFGVVFAGVLGLPAAEGGGVVLPLLATQILWINLVTDGGPALALGVDPPDGDVMKHPPRSRGEPVITKRMWRGVLLGGTVMAAGTLLVLDGCLPGGLIEGSGNLDYAHAMTFTTIVFFSLFMVFTARSEDRSAFSGLFSNRWLWAAVLLSLALQIAVIYVPFLQKAFSTVPLSFKDWLVCAAVASSILWLRELGRLVMRTRDVARAS